jgi:hypothetical protein
MVVLGIISVMMGVLLPALGKVRRRVRAVHGISNQRQIVCGLNLYAMDNNNRYPESVAVMGTPASWLWQDPRMLCGSKMLSPGPHRAMSEYLWDYIEDASVMYCPSAPSKYPRLQEAWDAGDDWDSSDPNTFSPEGELLSGTYCFYWNYLGVLEGGGLFRGPRGPSRERGRSELLVSDYFGYGNWRREDAYGSCEPFRGASVTPGRATNSAYWSGRAVDANDVSQNAPGIELHAGYADGHVETYSPADAVPMLISMNSNGIPPDGYWLDMPGSPGIFYLPAEALR